MRQCFFRAQTAACVSQLFDQAHGQQFGQALQSAHIGHHANVDFLDTKESFARGVSNAASGHHVDGPSNAPALNGRDHRHAQALKQGEGRLQIGQDVKHRSAPFRAVVVHRDGA